MAITLDLLRHGYALPAGTGGDRGRALSPEGIRGLEALATRLAGEGWRPDRAFSSPYPRARQSAAIVAAAAATPLEVEVLDDLQPERDPEGVLEALGGLGIATGHVLLVAHLPLLGLLAGRLAGDDPGFAPGTLVRVHCPLDAAAGAGRVVLTLSPGER
jgi:phosphohistidine phosphatase